MAAAIRRNKVTELVWSLHRFLYRVSGGRLGGRVVACRCSCSPPWAARAARRGRASHLSAEGRASVVFASNAGEPRHPAWWLNLVADPHATVQRGQEVVPVIAREAEGEERARLWDEVVRAYEGTPNTSDARRAASRWSCWNPPPAADRTDSLRAGGVVSPFDRHRARAGVGAPATGGKRAWWRCRRRGLRSRRACSVRRGQPGGIGGRSCGAQGTRGAIRRVAEPLRVALLTESAPAVDPPPRAVNARARRSTARVPGAPRRSTRSTGVFFREQRRRERTVAGSSAGPISVRSATRRVPRRGGSRHERPAPSTRARPHDCRWPATRRPRATAP